MVVWMGVDNAKSLLEEGVIDNLANRVLATVAANWVLAGDVGRVARDRIGYEP